MLKDPNRDWYTIKEVAALLGTSRTVVYRLITEGTLQPVRNPHYAGKGPVRIAKTQVETYLTARHQ